MVRMKRMIKRSIAVVGGVWLAAQLVNCGGGMKYKVDDAALDQGSAGEKQGLFAAQDELEREAAHIAGQEGDRGVPQRAAHRREPPRGPRPRRGHRQEGEAAGRAR